MPPKPMRLAVETRTYYPCHRRPTLDFRRRRGLRGDEQQWWEQQCPDCDQRYRFIATAAGLVWLAIGAFTDPGQGDRSLPVDPWLMGLQIVRERDAA